MNTLFILLNIMLRSLITNPDILYKQYGLLWLTQFNCINVIVWIICRIFSHDMDIISFIQNWLFKIFDDYPFMIIYLHVCRITFSVIIIIYNILKWISISPLPNYIYPVHVQITYIGIDYNLRGG